MIVINTIAARLREYAEDVRRIRFLAENVLQDASALAAIEDAIALLLVMDDLTIEADRRLQEGASVSTFHLQAHPVHGEESVALVVGQGGLHFWCEGRFGERMVRIWRTLTALQSAMVNGGPTDGGEESDED